MFGNLVHHVQKLVALCVGGKEGLNGMMLFEGLTNMAGVGIHASEYIVPCLACLSSWYNLKFAILETPSQLVEVCEPNCDLQLKA